MCAPCFVISGPKWEVGERTQNETRRRRLETRRRPPEIDFRRTTRRLLEYTGHWLVDINLIFGIVELSQFTGGFRALATD